MSDLIQDVRYGIRTLVWNPGFTAVAVLILALGIGANSTLFTMVSSIYLERPPLVEKPEELLGFTYVQGDNLSSSTGYPDYKWFRDENEIFSDILAYAGSPVTIAVGGGDEVSQAEAWVVSGNYFDVLGVPMAVGRSFAPEESVTPNTHPVAVISDGFWKRYFGADPDIVGRTLRVNGFPFTVIGVAPAQFRGISPVEAPPDIYVPIMMQGKLMPGSEDWLERREETILIWLRMVGRLKPGVEMEEAQAHIDVMLAQYEQEFSGWLESLDYEPGSMKILLTSGYQFRPDTANEISRLLTLLFLVVGVVLLIAVANLSILLLARASARQREVGIRAALGAGRARVLRQLLTESCLLALLGGIVGLLVAVWGARLASSLMPMTFAIDFSPNATVALFTLALSGATAVLFGLLPAWQLARTDIVSFLHRRTARGPRASLRNVLVVLQVAMSIVLVTGAGLFVRSLASARGVDLGFEAGNKLLLTVQLANHGYDEIEGRQFIVGLLEQLNATPGVEVATTSWHTPFRGMWVSSVTAPGTEYADEEHLVDSGFNSVGPRYFEAMSIPLVAGRGIALSDDESAPPVAVVNQTFARQVWGTEDAVGKLIVRGDTETVVVGVAKDANYYNVGEEPEKQVYMSQLQRYWPRVTFIVATRGGPAPLAPVIVSQIRALDPNIAIYNVGTLGEVIDSELAPYRVMAILVSLFGGLALFLAAVGLYGVQSYLVAGRFREIGIRMALGALQGQVARAVLVRGLALGALGVLLGSAAALGLTRLVEGMLFGISERDPVTFFIVPLILLGVAILASFLPARRASRVDPMVALREE